MYRYKVKFWHAYCIKLEFWAKTKPNFWLWLSHNPVNRAADYQELSVYFTPSLLKKKTNLIHTWSFSCSWAFFSLMAASSSLILTEAAFFNWSNFSSLITPFICFWEPLGILHLKWYYNNIILIIKALQNKLEPSMWVFKSLWWKYIILLLKNI